MRTGSPQNKYSLSSVLPIRKKTVRLHLFPTTAYIYLLPYNGYSSSTISSSASSTSSGAGRAARALRILRYDLSIVFTQPGFHLRTLFKVSLLRLLVLQYNYQNTQNTPALFKLRGYQLVKESVPV